VLRPSRERHCGSGRLHNAFPLNASRATRTQRSGISGVVIDVMPSSTTVNTRPPAETTMLTLEVNSWLRLQSGPHIHFNAPTGPTCVSRETALLLASYRWWDQSSIASWVGLRTIRPPARSPAPPSRTAAPFGTSTRRISARPRPLAEGPTTSRFTRSSA